MSTSSVTDRYTPKPETRLREEIPEKYRWNVEDIFSSWDEWEAAYKKLEGRIDELAAFKGRLAENEGETLLRFLTLHDDVGMESYRIWYYPSLKFDQDQRRNEIDARRQRVQHLFARFNIATAWYSPELLSIGLDRIHTWMEQNEELAVYRFSIDELYRLQEHVLDEQGEHLLSLSSQFGATPSSIYSMLSTADADFPEVELSTGEKVTVSPSGYSSLLHTSRVQEDRAKVFRAHYGLFEDNQNTYAAIYNGVLQRGWFHAQAREYDSVLEGKLHGNAIPTDVVTTLIDTARQGAGALQRYHKLRRDYLGLEDGYHLYDGFAPLVERDLRYGYDEVQELILDSVKILGDDYVQTMREGFEGRWIDVYENEGKRSGAYSASVYGVHPYMLLNYQDTLSDVFTLAHEMGHSMHSILSDRHQPFIYSSYTIFVAEVASTLNESLLLDEMLRRSDDPVERAMLLQHTIDGIAGTFYTQSMFADYELRAHRRAESGEPITADALNEVYYGLLHDFYGDAIDHDELYRVTWARIPHFFQAPYYVYQYATCYASSATIMARIRDEGEPAVARYLDLLKSGSSDHPMELLRRAGADLSKPGTVRNVVSLMDGLVDQLEKELKALA